MKNKTNEKVTKDRKLCVREVVDYADMWLSSCACEHLLKNEKVHETVLVCS